MKGKEAHLFTCGEFAQLCGTTKATLRHYEKYGLLLPAVIRENQYRYYSFDQLYQYDLIRTEILCGKSLTQIRDYLQGREDKSFAENAIENLESLKARRRELDRVIAEIECAIVRENRMAMWELSLGEPAVQYLNQSVPVVTTLIGPVGETTAAQLAQAAREHLRLCEEELNTSRFPWGQMVLGASAVPGQEGTAYYYSIYPFADISVAARDRLYIVPAGAYACVRYPSGEYRPQAAYQALARFAREKGYRLGEPALESGVFAQGSGAGRCVTQLAVALRDFPTAPHRGQELSRGQLRAGYYDTGTC